MIWSTTLLAEMPPVVVQPPQPPQARHWLHWQMWPLVEASHLALYDGAGDYRLAAVDAFHSLLLLYVLAAAATLATPRMTLDGTLRLVFPVALHHQLPSCRLAMSRLVIAHVLRAPGK